MNETKTLPMHYPLITSYPTHANILSCVLQYQDSLQWFYDHYIQLFGGKDLSKFCYIDFYSPIPWKSCPWIHYQKINPELIAKKWDSITEFIINSIELGFYVFLYLDCFYIPANTLCFQQYHFAHETFIYGYDLIEKTVNIADFYGKYSKYCYTTANFAQIAEAYSKVVLPEKANFIDGIILIKPIQYDSYTFNKNMVLTLLSEYLASKTTKGYSDGYRKDVDQNWAFGINIYKLVQEHLELYLQQKIKNIDIRGFQVLVDHKTLMLSRIKYFLEKDYLTNGSQIYNNYQEIKRQTLMLRNKIIKGALAEKQEIIIDSIKLIPNIVNKEKSTLDLLLNSII